MANEEEPTANKIAYNIYIGMLDNEARLRIWLEYEEQQAVAWHEKNRAKFAEEAAQILGQIVIQKSSPKERPAHFLDLMSAVEMPVEAIDATDEVNSNLTSNVGPDDPPPPAPQA